MMEYILELTTSNLPTKAAARFKYLGLILLWLTFMPSYAATVKFINTSSVQINSNEYIAFDTTNQLQQRKLGLDITHALKAVCNPQSLTDNSPAPMLILATPLVVDQRCAPILQTDVGYEQLAGLSQIGEIRWQYPTNLMIIGASADGIVLYSTNTGEFKILSPVTGQLLYPTGSQNEIRFKNSPGIAVYDANREILYKIIDDYANDDPSILYSIDMRNGLFTTLGTLPRQYFTHVHAVPYKMLLTDDKQFLAVISHLGSRVINSHDIFMIYDLNAKKWIYQQTISPAFLGCSDLVMGSGDNVGVLLCGQAGKLSHYIIIK